jgi:hypothetical protein
VKLKLLFIILALPFVAFAQEQASRVSSAATFNIGAGSYRGSASIAYDRTWRLGKKKQRLGLGIGARFTSFVGTDLYYVTAPAKLTTESTSPLVIFQENVNENIDSLLVNSSQLNALNLFINIDYKVSDKIKLGFSIDAIGFSFGSEARGNFMSGQTGKNTTAKPTPFNILLISDNDKGSLNSDLYVDYLITNRWSVRAGAQFLFTEYTTKDKVQTHPEENDRFRNKSLLGSIGVSLKL